MDQTQTILITGGAGFLGYHLANHLAPQGHTLILSDIAPFNTEEYPPSAICVQGDTRNAQRMSELVQQHSIRTIIHAAAALPLWSKRDIYAVNVEGTRNVLNAAHAAGVERVVFVGSTAVYGVPKKHPILEDDPLVGVGPYGITKIEGERLCAQFRRRGMCVPIVRPKTFIGTGRLGVFQILYDWVQSGCRIPVIGHGRNRYQLLEVTDLAEAIHLCVTADTHHANDTFNVGAKSFQTVREDVGRLCEYAASGATVMGTPAWLVKPALRLFEAIKLSPLYKWVYGTADRDSYVSIEKIQQQLGWTPKYSNQDALIRSYQWYLDHQEESNRSSGVTHRVAWNQGILKLFKWALRRSKTTTQ